LEELRISRGYTHIEATFNAKLVKSFLDVIVLTMLLQGPIHGYKLIADIHTLFGVLLSPGSLYPFLYSLEKEQLVNTQQEGKRKQYVLTSEGRMRVTTMRSFYNTHVNRIQKFLDNELTMSVINPDF